MSSLDGLTSGISNTLTFTDVDGVKDFAILESFQSQEDADVLQETAMDGITRHPKLYKGWSGSFTVQRGSNALDRYIAAAERNYYALGDQVNATITQSITELDGTTTQYQYTGVVIKLDDAGTYSGTDIVRQSASFVAQRKQLLSA